MAQEVITPFLIEPRFVERIWGYRDLRPWYDMVVDGDGQPIGEVWLTGDECRIASGDHAGSTLGQLFTLAPQALLGKDSAAAGSPLLIKVIFAREKLSVQVHPDDKLAQKYGELRGKTECWYALDAEPGAQVAAGLKPGVTMDEIRQGIEEHTLEQSLNVLAIAQGDMIFVEAGTVHAIWPGSILLETQQNSDLTYRMYDYGRPRELHIEKSLESTRLETSAGKVKPRVLADRTVLVDADYFTVERLPIDGSRASANLARSGDAPGLAYLFASSGSARISGDGFSAVDLPARSLAAVPASSPAFAVEDLGGLDLIRMTPRWPAQTK